MKFVLAIALLTTLGMGPAISIADSGEKTDDTASSRESSEAKAKTREKKADEGEKDALTIYVPPSRGAAGARTGGGTRGAEVAPRIAVLAPDHVGLTTRPQPALAWFLSGDTRSTAEVTVIADGAIEPLLVANLESPLHAGIQLVELSDLGVELEPGVVYDWFVALVLDADSRDSDVLAGGAVERVAASASLQDDLAGGEPDYRVLARHGIWYDAIGELSNAIAATPEDDTLRAERAALLEQVGVGAAAAYDRARGMGGTP